MLEAEVTIAGDVLVEGQNIGRLQGFQFTPDAQTEGQDRRALRAAAQKVLLDEIELRAEKMSASPDETFVLSSDGVIRWYGDAVAKIVEGEKLLNPGLRVLADDSLSGEAHEKVEMRLRTWITAQITKFLGALSLLENAEDITGIARGIATQLTESLGVLDRARVAQDVKNLDQEGRATLRRYGIRFGAYHLYMPQLLKPAPRALAAQLWALKNDGADQPGLDDIAHLAVSGRTSFKVSPDVSKSLYLAAGFRVCGERVLRVDILERLADLIRPAISYKPGITAGEPPPGTADGDGFIVTVAMTSLTGCAGEDFASILRSLGYISEKRMGPAITVDLIDAPRLVYAPGAEQDEADKTSDQDKAKDDEGPQSLVKEAEKLQEEAPVTVTGNAVEQETPMPDESTPDAISSTAETEEEIAPVVEIEIWRLNRPQYGQRHAEKRGRASSGQGELHARSRSAGSAQGEARTARQERQRRLNQFGEAARGGEGRPFSKNRHADAGRKGAAHHKQWQEKKEGARRPNRAPDPDSPFAKLAALKQELEGNAKNK